MMELTHYIGMIVYSCDVYSDLLLLQDFVIDTKLFSIRFVSVHAYCTIHAYLSIQISVNLCFYFFIHILCN